MENLIFIAQNTIPKEIKIQLTMEWIRYIISILILAAIPIAIVCIVKSVKKRNRQRQEEQRADEERRHQEIIQAIRESGKMPEDNK